MTPAAVASIDTGPVVTRIAGVEARTVGTGLPVTVFAHGLGGSAQETRPLAVRTAGTRVLFTFRCHGDSEAIDGGWSYDDLADDLSRVADAFGATRAVGLSLGAGALMRLLSVQPDRFERVAFVLPATLDEPGDDRAIERLFRLGEVLATGDRDGVVQILLAEVPASIRRRHGVQILVDRRARQMLDTLPPFPRNGEPPLPDLHGLSRVTTPALVVSQADDPLHPTGVAARLATALPHCEHLQLAAGGVFWTEARRAQDALARHLSLESP